MNHESYITPSCWCISTLKFIHRRRSRIQWHLIKAQNPFAITRIYWLVNRNPFKYNPYIAGMHNPLYITQPTAVLITAYLDQKRPIVKSPAVISPWAQHSLLPPDPGYTRGDLHPWVVEPYWTATQLKHMNQIWPYLLIVRVNIGKSNLIKKTPPISFQWYAKWSLAHFNFPKCFFEKNTTCKSTSATWWFRCNVGAQTARKVHL